MKEPVVIEYNNGSFKLKLSKAAETSYGQGGKLSFWELVVTAPDGRVFDIGINSESLISTFFETTVKNGDIEGDFYLGRSQGQQSVSKKDGAYYKDFIEQSKIKKTSLTNKYNIGEMILNRSEEYIYLGEFLSYYQSYYGDDSYIIRRAKPPVKKYLYCTFVTTKELTKKPFFRFDDKKIGGRVFDKVSNEKVDNLIDKAKTEFKENLEKRIKYNRESRENKWYSYEFYLLLEYLTVNQIKDISTVDFSLDGEKLWKNYIKV
jgi:hypothetical protein